MRGVMAVVLASLVAGCAEPAETTPTAEERTFLPLSMEDAREFWRTRTFRCDEWDGSIAEIECHADYRDAGQGEYTVWLLGNPEGVRVITASVDVSTIDEPAAQLQTARGLLGSTLPEMFGSAEAGPLLQEWISPRLETGAVGQVAGFQVQITVSPTGPTVQITRP